MHDNTPVQSYHRRGLRPVKRYRPHRDLSIASAIFIIVLLIMILSLGGMAEILLGLEELR